MNWFNVVSTILRIIAIALLLIGAVGDNLGRDYYFILRFSVCGIAIYISYFSYKLAYSFEEGGWPLTFGIIAFIFNPIFLLHLGKSLWTVVDLITAGIILVSIFILRDKISPASLYPKIIAGIASLVAVTGITTVAVLFVIQQQKYNRTKHQSKQQLERNERKQVSVKPLTELPRNSSSIQEKVPKSIKSLGQQRLTGESKEIGKERHDKEVKGGYFAIGSSKETVLSVQGQPSSYHENWWTYGFSTVRFGKDGNVISYSISPITLK